MIQEHLDRVKPKLVSRVEDIAALKGELDSDWEDTARAQTAWEPRHSDASSKGAALQMINLQKSYAGRKVLKGINSQIRAGEFVAVIGRSGCGKSTLLRLLAGLEKSDTGSVEFAETQPRPDTRVMFQDSRLLPWKNVLDNVALGVKNGKGAASQALQQVDLADRADDWPAVLSGGQRQRVALARALVHDPALLLLDEPLGALDALTRIEMQNLIESLWRERGFTAVLVTHDVQEAIALADRVILIEDGQITLDEQVTLPRPRARGHADFAELEERILNKILQRPARSLDALLGDVSLLHSVHQVAWAI